VHKLLGREDALSTLLVNANVNIKMKQQTDLKTKFIYREKTGCCSSAVPTYEAPLQARKFALSQTHPSLAN